MKLDPYHPPSLEINSKWISDLNARPKTLKLLEEKIEKKLQNIRFDNGFLDMLPKAQATKVSVVK